MKKTNKKRHLLYLIVFLGVVLTGTAALFAYRKLVVKEKTPETYLQQGWMADGSQRPDDSKVSKLCADLFSLRNDISSNVSKGILKCRFKKCESPLTSKVDGILREAGCFPEPSIRPGPTINPVPIKTIQPGAIQLNQPSR